MKSLVVVSALVAVAIAAPALPGDGLENTDRTQDWHLQAQSSIPDTLKRERKSPSEISTSSILNNGVSNSEVQNVPIDAGVSTPTGRSFVLKKPLIVKKKYGYQVYRDSEEEKAHADSNETCGRQVKVKLCNEDDKLRTSVTGSTHDGLDIHTTEDDVKHSIKMAKEAVENLQRDLKKMEMKTEMKTAPESQSDTELHEDIEVARQALKHIHDNFGTMESMSLHASTTRNLEDMHDIHVTIAKTEEERMAQWKEALENIQKNMEVAKNIEDSFKDASNQDSHLDQSEVTVADKITEGNMFLHEALSEINNLRLAQDATLETLQQEEKAADEMILHETTNEHLNEHNIEDDMKSAPSEMIEIHLNNIKNQEPLRSENHKIHEQEKSAEAKLEEHNVLLENKDFLNKENIVAHHQQEKSSELNLDMFTDQSEHHIMQVPFLKTVEQGTETKFDVQNETAFKTSENIPVVPITTRTIAKPLSSDAFSEHQKSAEEITIEDKIAHHLEQEKTAGDGIIDFLAKSADHLDQDKIEKADLHKEQLNELAKAAEISKPGQQQHLPENSAMKPKEAVEITKPEQTQHVTESPDMKPQEAVEMTKPEQQQRLTENWEMKPMEAVEITKPEQQQHLTENWEMKPKEAVEMTKPEQQQRLTENWEMKPMEAVEITKPEQQQHLTENWEMKPKEAVEITKPEQQQHLTENWEMKPKEAVEMKLVNNIPKSAEQLEHTHFHNLGQHNENVMLAKSVDHASILDHQKQQMMHHEELPSMETVAEMRVAEDHLHHLQHMHNAHWAHEHRQLSHLSSMKAAEDFDNEFRMSHGQMHGLGVTSEHAMDHLKNPHLAELGHIPNKMGVSHDLASHISTHPHHHSKHNHNSMAHQQTHGMSGMDMHSNFHPSMRDAMEGFGSDHMYRWAPTHESARMAYGSGLSTSAGSTGAVGVFPNANIGGCGIPLLLSCSPSVVSGSLAKPHSAGPASYSVPSYRAEEDFAFHNKRDIKKTNDMRTTNVLRSPTIVKQKSSTITLEKKM